MQSWEHLNDWPSLLFESKKYIGLVSPQKKIDILFGDATPQYMKFLVSIAQHQTQTRHLKVLTNIDITALNLHIMWKVFHTLRLNLQRLTISLGIP